MCDHRSPSQRAISLSHGTDHDRDHRTWSRRDFLVNTAAAAGGAAFLLRGGVPAYAASHSPLLRAVSRTESDRILVLIQLAGGNDGLNTVVPVGNDLYYQRRPSIAVPRSSTFALNEDYGLHGAMSALQPRWDDGEIAVIQTVGYPDHNLSHFRSTDIWASASNADETLRDGWTGRWVDAAYPGHVASPPDSPVAVRIGGASGLLVRGGDGTLGMSFSHAGQLEQLAETGQLYDESDVPDTAFGDELAFVRQVYNSGVRYRDAVVAASDQGSNDVEYPDGSLGRSLAAIARLIKGGLGSRIFVVQHGGFDTHSNQSSRHPDLLASLANAVWSFTADLQAGGQLERTLTMTFSEFGRRVEENGARGTDHGTAAPVLLFGGGLNGGLYGEGPALDDLDPSGNLRHSVDFRSIYATVLGSWFGLAPEATAQVLGGSFSDVGFVAQSATSGEGLPAPPLLESVGPNPARDYVVARVVAPGPMRATLRLVDLRGREVRILHDRPLAAGPQALRLDLSGLPAAAYMLHLDAGGSSASHLLTVLR